MTPPLTEKQERRRRYLDEREQRQWDRQHGIEDPGATALASVVVILFLMGLALFHPGAAAVMALLWVASLQKDNR